MTIIDPPGQIVIQFEGVCVNFKQTDFPFLPTAHRIVMINASTITNVWNMNIAPHVAGFSTDVSPDAPATPFNGAVVQIANASGNGVTYIPKGEFGAYDEIPSLAALNPDLGLTPEMASLAVLAGHNPALASCYFDVDSGVIGSARSGGATMTVVTIPTVGPPMYRLTPFATGLSSRVPTALQAQKATNSMFFWNAETDVSQASIWDFLLNYLVVKEPPSGRPNVPDNIPIAGSARNRKSEMLARLPNRIEDFTDVGCSNSTYP